MERELGRFAWLSGQNREELTDVGDSDVYTNYVSMGVVGFVQSGRIPMSTMQARIKTLITLSSCHWR